MSKKFLTRLMGSTRVLLLSLIGVFALCNTDPVAAERQWYCSPGGHAIGSETQYRDVKDCQVACYKQEYCRGQSCPCELK